MGHKRTRSKPQRLRMAQQWIPTYNGTKIVKDYKKKFAVDTLTAISDLQELGVQFEPEYISAVEIGEKSRLLQLQEKKQERLVTYENGIDSFQKVGKNHIRVNGTLLQTNKKWSQLKQKQRDWIYEITRSEHKNYITENDRLPMKIGKKKLIAVIETKMDERGIWLPPDESTKRSLPLTL
jgi:hypothetical protein